MKGDTALLKQAAAYRAVEFVESGMIIGLGHGTTALYALRRIAELVSRHTLEDILAIPCSLQMEHEARTRGIPLTTFDEYTRIDLTIDGADEVDPDLNLIKGGGGALLREKIVAQASAREIIVVDESKLTPSLGTLSPVPVEVLPFGFNVETRFIEQLGAAVKVRKTLEGSLFLTDQGNLILDCTFGPIPNPPHLAAMLSERAGIVEHGLFINIATDVIVAGSKGIRHLVRSGELPA